MERLRQETLNLSCTVNRNLILLGKLLHAKDCNDILKLCIFLQNLLNTACRLIMLLADNVLLQNTRIGFQRIDCRINSLLHNLSGKHRCRIQMGESSRRSRISQIIRRHIDCLYRSNGTVLCRCDPLLKLTNLIGKRRLISYCGRHTSQQGGHLRTRLYKTEDIINE